MLGPFAHASTLCTQVAALGGKKKSDEAPMYKKDKSGKQGKGGKGGKERPSKKLKSK